MVKKNPNSKKMAKKHIEALFELERKILYKDENLANRYVKLIRRLAMKFRLKTSREIKRSYCKHCKTALIPGKNCRIRTRDEKLIYYCYNCKKYTRIPLQPRRKQKNSSEKIKESSSTQSNS